MGLVFYDETGYNPLPAGINVSVWTPSGALVAQAFTLPGGVLIARGVANGNFLATFVGTQAPSEMALFSADAEGNAYAIVENYRSPSLSIVGYATEETNLWPSGWFSDAAKAQGGNAYAVAIGLAGVLNYLDQQGQTLLAMQRLQSCTGTDIDSWALDFFGPQWSRFAGQTDASWSSMIQSILQIPKLTITGIQEIINVFWPWIELQFGSANLAFDTGQGGVDTRGGVDVVSPSITPAAAGLAEGVDTFGGVDTGTTFIDAPGPAVLPPTPIVFDLQSNPTLAALITPNIVKSQVCIYLRYPSFSDTLIHPVQPQSVLLDYLVRAWKAAGVVPIYAQNQ